MIKIVLNKFKYENILQFIFFFPMVLLAKAGYGLPIHKVSRSHSTMHHIRQDSSVWVVSPSQRPLPENTQQSQQTSMLPTGFEATISAG